MPELVARAFVALLTAHILPGWLVVGGLGLGRSKFERWVMAAVVGGPFAAFIYWVYLLSGESVLYWVIVGALDTFSLVVVFRHKPTPGEVGISGRAFAGLATLVVVVGTAYYATTGTMFRLDAGGELVMDRALQRDTLFHVGMVRSLLASYPPEVLTCSGVEATYHVVYHLQVAAWSHFYGIDVLDGVYRVGMEWSLGLLILSAFLLGRRFAHSEGVGLLAAVLVFASGLGILSFSSNSVDWWSLAFVDVTLVSLFLVNPLLPALPLLFVGLLCLSDHLETGDKGKLLGSALCLVSLLRVKVFLGVQIVGGIAFASMPLRGSSARRLRIAAVFLSLCAIPFLLPLLIGTERGNIAIGLRPLEIVRYSMEKLEWNEMVHALAEVGRGSARLEAMGWALVAALVWAVGYLGLRLVALPGWLRDVRNPRDPLRRSMAYAVLIGFPVALLVRIAPAEATGLSRLEAANDVIWFAAQSSILLWFWTAEVLVDFGKRGKASSLLAAAAVAGVALPCTIQHFVYKSSLGNDRVSAEAFEAAGTVQALSAAGDAWVDPPSRVHPSLIAYLAGRPVVHDGYVGYDYLFVPKEETDFRRHAVAQFWRTKDPAFARWFFSSYVVRGVWASTDFPLPSAALGQVESSFENSLIHLYRVTEAHERPAALETPERIRLGLVGAPYFGEGWGRPRGSPRVRVLMPGNAVLYIPIQEGRELLVKMEIDAPHPEGQFYYGGKTLKLGREESVIRLTFPPVGRTGLQRVEFEWVGPAPLTIERIQLSVD